MSSFSRSDFWMKYSINVLTAVGAGISTMSIYWSYLREWRTAWILLGLAMVVDCLDGPFVRYFELEDALPQFDGERLDEYADLLTYVVAPVCQALFSGMIPENPLGMATVFVVVGTACLQFSRQDNKTENAFRGWPSYWNIIYFYTWSLGIGSHWVVLISLFLAAGTLLPVSFAYPSKLPVLRKTTLTLNAGWLVILGTYLIYPEISRIWLGISLLFPLYYACLSVFLNQY